MITVKEDIMKGTKNNQPKGSAFQNPVVGKRYPKGTTLKYGKNGTIIGVQSPKKK